MAVISIVLADDHTLIRQGLRALLEPEPELKIIGEAEDGRDAVDIVGKLYPDIVLMDITMAGLNGLEATRLISTVSPDTQVIILSMHANAEYVLQALKAGARGYIVKHGIKEELILAIQAVHRGEQYLTSRVSSSVIQGYLDGAEIGESLSGLDKLTSREREILQLIAEGFSSPNIADRLTLSRKTVERHRSNLMDKLDIHNIAGLVQFAIRSGLITSDN
jgi:DNA-binding NarL/FixJ family response regulator